MLQLFREVKENNIKIGGFDNALINNFVCFFVSNTVKKTKTNTVNIFRF
jgi:hypothetical protein